MARSWPTERSFRCRRPSSRITSTRAGAASARSAAQSRALLEGGTGDADTCKVQLCCGATKSHALPGRRAGRPQAEPRAVVRLGALCIPARWAAPWPSRASRSCKGRAGRQASFRVVCRNGHGFPVTRASMRAVPVLVSLVVLAAAFPLTGPAQAHPVDVVVEGEAFDTRDEGSLLADPAASGGAAWRLDGPGNVSTGWSGDHAGTYQISVWAKGSASGGPAPEMTVFDDGRAVGHWRVNDAYVRYVANDTVAQASHRLSVALTDVP